MEPWLSIVIPVYNAGKYIKRAIDSIINQNINGVEIIVVDDGSTDNSYTICEQIAGICNQVKLIHSENKGVSHARNVGMSCANGEWISFLDADDYLIESRLSLMQQATSGNEDLIVFNYIRDNTPSNREDEEILVMESKEAIKVLLDFERYIVLLPSSMKKNHSVFKSCWGKLYRKSLIQSNGIVFQETLTLSEDMCFNLEYMRHIKSVMVIDCEVYNYSNNFESVTHTFSEKKFLGRQQIISYLKCVDGLEKECELAKQKYVILTVLQLAEQIGTVNSEELNKKYIALLKQYEIMKSASNRIDRQFSISAKQNCYLNIQYWMLKHRMYNAILILGRIYAKIRGQK